MRKYIKISVILISCLAGICILIILASVLLIRQFAKDTGNYEAWSENDGIVFTNLRYGTAERNVFDLYIPFHKEKHDSVGVMLFIHGGAWMGGEKEDMSYACRRYTKQGYITATMNYTLIDSTKQSNIPKMLQEIQACIHQIKDELYKRDFHPSRIALGGVSAGGHLAMLYAYKYAQESPIPIAFIVQRVGPTDFTKMFPITQEKINDLTARKEIDNLIFNVCNIKDIPPQWYRKQTIDSLLLQASPVHFINAHTVPGIFAYGGKDMIVPITQADTLIAAYNRFNIPYHYVFFPHSNHTLESDPELHNQLTQFIKEYARKYFGY